MGTRCTTPEGRSEEEEEATKGKGSDPILFRRQGRSWVLSYT